MRYYDSLKTPSELALPQAQNALSLLALAGFLVEEQVPLVEASVRQSDCVSCGFYVLFFLEEECIRWRLEGRWTRGLRLADRRERVEQIWKFLTDSCFTTFMCWYR